MIRISEFSPSIASSKNPQAKCKVVINNTIKERDITNPEMPKIEPAEELRIMYPPINEDDVNYTSLYKHLAIAFSNILKSNNPKLIANVIDMSGKVILSAEDLVDAISLMLNIDRNLITISYEDPEAGCLNRINPIKKITAIRVNGYDFNLGYNRQYNMLSSTFGISLTQILIGI